MEFKIFKKHIERVQNTIKKEEAVSKCIEEYLSSSTYCIVDISSEACTSVEELLADYYGCTYEILGRQENDISWWIYEEPENRKFYIKNDDGTEEEIDLSTVESLWQYLEKERKRKLAEKNNDNACN